MSSYQIITKLENNFNVKCTKSNSPPFKENMICKARDKADKSEDEFVLLSPISYNGIRYDYAVIKYTSENWEFEKI